MRLINIKCRDKESFKYSVILYLYYYNMQKNHGRVMQLLFNTDPYLDIKFNENNDINQKTIHIFIYLLLILIIIHYS